MKKHLKLMGILIFLSLSMIGCRNVKDTTLSSHNVPKQDFSMYNTLKDVESMVHYGKYKPGHPKQPQFTLKKKSPLKIKKSNGNIEYTHFCKGVNPDCNNYLPAYYGGMKGYFESNNPTKFRDKNNTWKNYDMWSVMFENGTRWFYKKRKKENKFGPESPFIRRTNTKHIKYTKHTKSHVDICQSYIGKTIKPESLRQTLKKIPELPKKDELETTIQCNKRKYEAFKNIPKYLIIKDETEIRKQYNADKQSLAITQPKYSGPPYLKYPSSFLDMLTDSTNSQYYRHKSITVIKTEKDRGVYNATNAFGVMTPVRKVKNYVGLIYDHVVHMTFDQYVEHNFSRVVRVPVSISEYKKTRHSIRLSYLVSPKTPYKVHKDDFSLPEISKPVERRINIDVLYADIECSFITSKNNKVFYAYKY